MKNISGRGRVKSGKRARPLSATAHLGHLWWDGSQCAAGSQNRLDVFAAGTDGQLTHKLWDGSSWSSWDWVGGSFRAIPRQSPGEPTGSMFLSEEWTTISATSGEIN